MRAIAGTHRSLLVSNTYVQLTVHTLGNFEEYFNPSTAVLCDPNSGCHLHVVLGHSHRGALTLRSKTTPDR
jgi:hypothetical protein